jgi:hypothetical protein
MQKPDPNLLDAILCKLAILAFLAVWILIEVTK